MRSYDKDTTLRLIQTAATLAAGALSEAQKGDAVAVTEAFRACLEVAEEEFHRMYQLPVRPSLTA